MVNDLVNTSEIVVEISHKFVSILKPFWLLMEHEGMIFKLPPTNVLNCHEMSQFFA